MTPQEAAAFAASHQYQPAKVQEFLLAAPPRDIQEFTHLIQASDAHDRCLNLARVALDVRLADDQAKAAEKLEWQMVELVGIAAAQRVLAAKLDRQTNRLIWLTWALLGVSVALLAVSVRDIVCPKDAAALRYREQAGTNQQVVVPSVTNR